jgi:O-antigen ligase
VYLLYSRIEQASEYRAFFYSMGILVGVCTLVGIAQFYANDPLFMGAYLNEVQQQERVTFGETVSKSVALFGHGNSFALLLSIVLPLFVGAAGSGVSSLVTVPVLALGGVGDLTTFSRGGWLALAIGYLSVLGFRWRGLRIRPGVTTFMLVLGVAAIGLVNQLGLFQLAIDRFTSEAFSERDLGSNLTRLVNLQAGWSAFLSRPLMGIGIGTSAVAYVQFGGFTDLGPHNLYLLVASERGVLAMGALVVLIGFTYADAWRLIRRTGDAVALGGLASWTALLVNGFFESVFVDVFLYFAFMALGLVASRLRSAQVRVHAIA